MKKLNQALVVTGGIVLILLGLFHLSFFWAMPEWKELNNLSQGMNNLMQMFNLGVISLLLSLGILLLWFRSEVLKTRLGRGLLLVIALFLLVRLIAEFAFTESSILMGVVLFVCILIYVIPALTIN